MTVAPCPLLPAMSLLGGAYWVIKADKDADGKYLSAIVMGGPPTVQNSKTGDCTTMDGPFARNNAGLWILSRKPEMDPVVLQEQKDWLKSQRIDTSKLLPVRQGDGWCSDYPGAFLKNTPLKFYDDVVYPAGSTRR
uniref:Uncharacterized protein n=1 Tax=Alexandrium catenella TaxID=2925 RepID=A0A7S1LZ08_ALECA